MDANTNNRIGRRAVAVIVGIALLVGCTSLASDGTEPSSAHEPVAVQQEQRAEKTGAELWAQWCNRCHNFRSPASLSDSQWNVVLMHMRVRANLTGGEQRAILEYLQAGN